MEIKRLIPNSLEKQENDIFLENMRTTRNALIKSAYIYDAKIIENLSNVLVNVISNGLRSSNFVKTASNRLSVMVGVGEDIDYAVYVDNKRHYMEKSWEEVESRIDKIMGVN